MKTSRILGTLALLTTALGLIWYWQEDDSSPGQAVCNAAEQPISLVFIVRHAEKDDDCLSPQGKERSQRLADVFRRLKVHHLIASTVCRTRETLEPLAAQQKIAPGQIAAVGDLGLDSAEAVARLVRTYRAGDVTVIAHHSTTVEAIAVALGVAKKEAASIDTSGHDAIALVLLPTAGAAQLAQLSYR